MLITALKNEVKEGKIDIFWSNGDGFVQQDEMEYLELMYTGGSDIYYRDKMLTC